MKWVENIKKTVFKLQNYGKVDGFRISSINLTYVINTGKKNNSNILASVTWKINLCISVLTLLIYFFTVINNLF